MRYYLSLIVIMPIKTEILLKIFPHDEATQFHKLRKDPARILYLYFYCAIYLPISMIKSTTDPSTTFRASRFLGRIFALASWWRFSASSDSKLSI